jgi:2,4-dienoyl-CoA reductase-like NADH-dependent reductase (Old Yellow Enzyme family)
MEESPEAAEFGSWDVTQSIEFAKLLPALGVDLLDVSSGGNNEAQRIMPHTDYQVQIAGRIRREIKASGLNLLIGAVGMITEAERARDIVQGADSSEEPSMDHNGFSEEEEAKMAKEMVEEGGNGKKNAIADAILVARQFMREPEWVLRVAWRLEVDISWPVQFGRGRFLRGSRI